MSTTEKESLLSGKQSGSTYTDLADSSTLSQFRKNSVAEAGGQYMTLFNEWLEKATNPWVWFVKTTHARQCLAEFFGTFLLVTIGNGAIAQFVLTDPEKKFGTFQSVNIGYALGLVIAVYVSIGVSGGHLNPAVSFAMALRGKMTWLMVVPFWIAQTLGAFFSSAVVYGVYVDAINNAGGKTNLTAGIFATYPQTYLTIGNGFLDQLFGTFLLLIGIFAVTDSKNSEVKAGLKPFIIGVILWAIGSSFGMNAGYAINPARDFGPRVFTAMAGWGKQVFVCDFCGNIRHWWWVPIIAPMLGAALAAFFYWFLIEAHHPNKDNQHLRRVTVNDDESKEP